MQILVGENVCCISFMTTRFAQVLIGPAGCGKSTYIYRAAKHYETIKRVVHCVNLDPAADFLLYNPTIDIRSVINVKDVMKRLKFVLTLFRPGEFNIGGIIYNFGEIENPSGRMVETEWG